MNLNNIGEFVRLPFRRSVLSSVWDSVYESVYVSVGWSVWASDSDFDLVDDSKKLLRSNYEH
jgi:hypothetical protein